MAGWNVRANEVFLNALEIAAPGDRRAYVESACGQDPELRQAVQALLKAHADAGSFLDGSVSVPGDRTIATPAPFNGVALTVDLPGLEKAGDVVAGRYKLLQQLGQGGMGTVWMAEQSEPIKRMVAVKVIKAGMDSAHVISRFEAERQALALMDHPNIAKVLDAGTTDSGRPYFVMELVKGISITKYCDERRLSPRDRLSLFVSVCYAVQHAHQKGVIHRDLKPSNVLVALYDGKPVPKVIDFGVAKATGHKLTEKTLFTGFGAIVGTLEYMSPEQAELNQLDVDTRSDIYSLGVLLYEMLTGSTPLDRKRLKETALLEMLRLIREQEPPKPSARLSSSETLALLSAQRQMEPAKLARLMRGELDWIVMKALEKDRDRRYETANGLARDIERYLKDEPVQAGPPSATYRLRKFVARNRGRVLAGLAIAFLLIAGTVVSTALAVWAFEAAAVAESARVNEMQQRQRAEQAEIDVRVFAHKESETRVAAVKAADEAIAMAVKEKAARKDADVEKNRANNERKRAEEGEAEVQKRLEETRQTLYTAQVNRAAALWQRDPVQALRLLEDKEICPPTAHDFAWHLYQRLCQTETPLFANPARQYCAAFSPDGKLLAVGCASNGTVLVWDYAAGKLLRSLKGHTGNVQAIAFTRDSKGLFSGGVDKQIVRWDLASGNQIGEPRVMDNIVFGLALDPKGEWLGAAIAERNRDPKRAPSTTYINGQILLWNLNTGATRVLQKGNVSGYLSIDFSPDGKLVAAGCSHQGFVRLWELSTGKEYATLAASGGWTHRAIFSHDGKVLAVSRADYRINLWDVAARKQLPSLEGHIGQVGSLAFSPDDKWLASSSGDNTVRVWDVEARGAPDSPREQVVFTGYVGPVAFTPNGRGLIAEKAGRLKDLTCYEGRDDVDARFPLVNLVQLALRMRAEARTLGYHGDGIEALAYSHDGKHLASASKDKSARLCNPFTGASVKIGPFDDPPGGVAFSPDDQTVFIGATLMTADKTKIGQIARFDVKSGKLLKPWLGHAGAATALAVSSRHHLLASGSDDALKVWSLKSGQLVAGEKVPVRALAFHSTEELLAGACADNSVVLWNVSAGNLKRWKTIPADVIPSPVVMHRGKQEAIVPALAFARDGKSLVIQAGLTVYFFDLNLGEMVHQFSTPSNGGTVLAFAITPDQRTVALGRSNRTIELWDVASKQLRATLTGHVREIGALAFSPDGTMLASGDYNQMERYWVHGGTIKLWNAAPKGL